MSTTSPRNRLVTAVAALGTAVGMLGVGHAFYASLATGPGLDRWALVEAVIMSLFLELLVAAVARDARQKADAGQRAGFSVGLVLVAAVTSGLVSGIAADGIAASLGRGLMPVLAGLLWLGSVVNTLRANGGKRGPLGLVWQRLLVRAGLADHGADQIEMDRERLLARIVTTVAICNRCTGRKYRRADARFVKLIAQYESIGGDRKTLADRLNGFHHRESLLRPTGADPWLSPELVETDAPGTHQESEGPDTARPDLQLIDISAGQTASGDASGDASDSELIDRACEYAERSGLSVASLSGRTLQTVLRVRATRAREIRDLIQQRHDFVLSLPSLNGHSDHSVPDAGNS